MCTQRSRLSLVNGAGFAFLAAFLNRHNRHHGHPHQAFSYYHTGSPTYAPTPCATGPPTFTNWPQCKSKNHTREWVVSILKSGVWSLTYGRQAGWDGGRTREGPTHCTLVCWTWKLQMSILMRSPWIVPYMTGLSQQGSSSVLVSTQFCDKPMLHLITYPLAN